MNESRDIPTATSFRSVPVDALAQRRTTLKGAGKKLSFTHLIAWAIVQAARDWPVMTNSRYVASTAPVASRPRPTPAPASAASRTGVSRSQASASPADHR